MLFWLGAGESVVGRTTFCVEPLGAVDAVTVVGGTKTVKVERVLALEPQLVIANKEENRREDIEALRAAGLKVLLTDLNSLDDAVSMIERIADIAGKDERGRELLSEIAEARGEAAGRVEVRAFVAVWKKPLLGLGSQSYGHDLLWEAGGVNVLADRPRYPEISMEELAALKPDVILLPDEPYVFKERDRAEFEKIAPARIVDGKMMWWYGPRIPAALRELRAILREAARG